MKDFSVKAYIGDAVLCIILALVLIASVLFLPIGKNDDNKFVRITVENEEVAVLPLDRENDGTVFGGVTVKISGGRAHISESNCRDGVCMTMHGVDKNGGGAVCLPNRVVLEPVSVSSDTDYIIG